MSRGQKIHVQKRAVRLDHRLPGSGKSLIARVLLEKLESRRIRAQIVSSDMLRRVITPVSKYTEAEFVHVYVITYAVYGVFHDLIDTRFYKKM